MGRGQGGGGRGGRGGGGTNSMGRVIGSNTDILQPGVTWGADVKFHEAINSLQPGDKIIFGSKAQTVRRVNLRTISYTDGSRDNINDLPRTFGLRAVVLNNSLRPIKW